MQPEPDMTGWLQEKMLGKKIVAIEQDEYGQITIKLDNGNEIGFTCEAAEPGLSFIDAFEV